MAGNTFGERFALTTFGESHGEAVGGIIDGCPSGVVLDFAAIDQELIRRRGEPSEGATTRREPDNVEWLSGLMDGKTLGTPIAFLVRNCDTQSDDYDNLREWMRPGHADYTYSVKYGIRDHRGGGRASGRETVARVIGGAVAKQILKSKGISITSQVWLTENSDKDDSTGGFVRCTINGAPAGLGEPVFDRLNAQLAYAMMSIPSAISFEMGIGIDGCRLKGSDWADQWSGKDDDTLTYANHCGGIQGGISNGDPIDFTVGFHPTVSYCDKMTCRNKEGDLKKIDIGGRHDRCHVPRTAVVVEAMAALTIVNLISL